MADEAQLSTVSFFDAFYYGMKIVLSSIVFIVALLIIQAIGIYIGYLGSPHCCMDALEDGEDNDFNGEIDDPGEAGMESTKWTEFSIPKLLIGIIIYLIAAIGFLAILIALWYKTWVDIISRSDFHFTKRDSF
tara:strand:- start:404 stop:802 length:399 start_codon:yes stop_codon:yes gene_type:complete